MNNIEKNGYKNYRIHDTHFHFVFAKEISESVKIFECIMDHFDLSGATLLSLSRCGAHRALDPTANVKGLYLRDLLSHSDRRIYVYGSPFHFRDERDTAEGYLAQVRDMYEMGVDGYKMLDGKPGYRRALGRSLADPVFDGMYSFMEETGMPLKMHICDPRKFWGPKESMTANAIARGWWYGDGSYPGFDEIWNEVCEVMKKFPRLKLCAAHFGYISDDIERVKRYFESWENFSFDMTPGASTFLSFTEKPCEWRQFLEKYSDRIYFGSDTYNKLDGQMNEEGLEATGSRINLIRRMLEHTPDEEIEYPSLGVFRPLCLDDGLLEKIYFKNARELHGDARKPDPVLIIKEAERLRSELKGGIYDMPESEIMLEESNLDSLIGYFGG